MYDVDSADTAIEVGDDEFWMLMSGRKLLHTTAGCWVRSPSRRRAWSSTRAHRRGRQGRAIAQADELRRSLLSAVSHDLRTPLAAAKAAVSSLRSSDVDFSAEDTAELLATIEESSTSSPHSSATCSTRRGWPRGCFARLRRVYLEETVQRALLGVSKGVTGFRRQGIDRVKVEVGDAVVMADSGLLERVLANLIDNALRYAPDSPVRVTAGQFGNRVLIAVVDEGPGIPRGTEDQLFAPFQRLGDHDTAWASALACRSLADSSRRWAAPSRPPTPRRRTHRRIELAAPPKDGPA